MAVFQDLSVDLIYIIISHLQSDKASLQHISLSCRLLRDISQRFIVRHVTLAHSPTISKSKLFLRTLEERPDLRAHVHRLELDLLREDAHWPEEQNNVNLLTRLLTNLREFRYLSRDYKSWHYSLPFPLKWASENAHSQVRRVDWHHSMTIETLWKCMELPRIETINCRDLLRACDSAEKATAFDISTIPTSSSSVTDLGVGSASGLPLEDFRLLLRSPRSLHKLCLEYRGKLHGSFEKDRIDWLLEPVQNTLQELSVSVAIGLESAADFSAFHALKKLYIPLIYLIGRYPDDTFRAKVLLPPRLCELAILFTATDSTEASSPYASRNAKALTNWLEHFRVKMGQSTDLSLVTLDEAGFRSYHGDLCRSSVRAMDGVWGKLKNDIPIRLRLFHQLSIGE
jgi:hypothetical protein